MIRLEGLDALIDKLGEMRSGDAVDRGIAKGVKAVQAQAKLLAPVDIGDLRDSIKTSEVALHTAEVYTNCDHAAFNEFGTGTKGDPSVPHTDRKSWTFMGTDGKFHTSHGMRPRPFMRPAAEFGKKILPELISAEIKKEVQGNG